ncbi:MAG: ABC transporter ATP-binding protein [Phycisphaerae bacterium]
MANESPVAIVKLDAIQKIYRKPNTDVQVHALRGVSFSILPGEYVAIIGASGSGKSTLMNILGCLDRPTAGRYVLDGDDISALDDERLSDVRGKRIGFIFQSFNLIPSQTVLENLETPMFYQGVPPRERRDKAIAGAERLGLGDRLDHKPTELSGGQQQRVAIARSLMNDPVLLLADEPTGNLDSTTGKLILQLLDELNGAGVTIVMVTHDPNVAARCKRVIEMRDGEVARDEMNR